MGGVFVLMCGTLRVVLCRVMMKPVGYEFGREFTDTCDGMTSIGCLRMCVSGISLDVSRIDVKCKTPIITMAACIACSEHVASKFSCCSKRDHPRKKWWLEGRGLGN